ncbi:MAG: thiamine diphosphokinase [Chloroflexi bacterium]|nr:thiamine diphosphokinase [Chloroflexota bacterium]
MHALVVADGAQPDREALDRAWPGWDRNVALVVAADGGARHATALGLRVDRWVGDGDSLGLDGVEALRAAGVPVELVPQDKDESDAELAIATAVGAGASEVTILGALGGPRFDHALANAFLLAHPRLRGRRARILDAAARITLLSGPARTVLEGRQGDLVTLLPLGADAVGVTTYGLTFALEDGVLEVGRTRGLSNVRAAQVARVELASGRLLIVESPATLTP